MLRTLALLLALTPSTLAAADISSFRFDAKQPRTFTLKRKTVFLDDSDSGVPHRFEAIEETAGTMLPTATGATVTFKPVTYVIKIDGFAAGDNLASAAKQSVITLQLDPRGLATSARGTEALQKLSDASGVARELYGRDVAASARAAWNDRLVLAGRPSAVGSQWELQQRDGTQRVWEVSGTEPCPAPAPSSSGTAVVAIDPAVKSAASSGGTAADGAGRSGTTGGGAAASGAAASGAAGSATSSAAQSGVADSIARNCTVVRSRWEADSRVLLKQAGSDPAAKTELREARLSARTEVLVDTATMLPYNETLRESRFVGGVVKGRKAERRTTRTVESEYVWTPPVP